MLKLIMLCRLLTQVIIPACLLAEEWKDIEFARPSGVPLTLDAFVPEGAAPQPAVLLVHGGGWEAGDKRTFINPWFPTLKKARLAWFAIDYRLAPEWKHPAALDDVESAAAWIRTNARRFRIDPDRIAIMGESAGGHLAALAALRARQKVKALVSFYGIHDLPSWFEQRGEKPRNILQYLPGVTPTILRDASPSTYVKRDSPPMLLIHGTADKGVPYAQSMDLCARAKAAGVRCETFLIEGAPHGVEDWELEPRFHVWKKKLIDWLRANL